jgi:metallo-beta-lactamase class B
MIYMNGPEAIIVDCPTNDSASIELLAWINTFNVRIEGVIINHFHVDCLGGLKAFHDAGIRSYAYFKTIAFAEANGDEVPKIGFKKYLSIPIGKEIVYTKFFGEAHTLDNVVTYIPGEKALFGGCMIKSDGAGYGNLEDSNQKAWPKTVLKIKEAYPEIELVIPGHGKPGGMGLLDYTVSLFTGKVVK